MLKFNFLKLEPGINEKSVFNRSGRCLDRVDEEIIPINVNVDNIISKNTLKKFNFKTTIEDINNQSNIKYLLGSKYPNFNSVFQIGFDNGFYSNVILRSINKKHVGNKKLLCIDSYSTKLINKKKIDNIYPTEFKLVLTDIYKDKNYRNFDFNIIFITKVLDYDEISELLFSLQTLFEVKIIFFHIDNLDIFRDLVNNKTINVSQVINNKNKYVVDFHFIRDKKDFIYKQF